MYCDSKWISSQGTWILTLLLSEQPKLHRVLAVLSAIGLSLILVLVVYTCFKMNRYTHTFMGRKSFFFFFLHFFASFVHGRQLLKGRTPPQECSFPLRVDPTMDVNAIQTGKQKAQKALPSVCMVLKHINIPINKRHILLMWWLKIKTEIAQRRTE